MLDFSRSVQSKRNEEGASAVEYGLLVAAIAALIVIIVFALGGIIRDSFNTTCDTIAAKDSNSASSDCSS